MHDIRPNELLSRLEDSYKLYAKAGLLSNFGSIRAFAVSLLIDDETNMTQAEAAVDRCLAHLVNTPAEWHE